jgi:uncharacterized protein YgiM (DUF1202 family)
MAKTNYSNMAKKSEPVVDKPTFEAVPPVVEEKKVEPPKPQTKRGMVVGCALLNVRKTPSTSADIVGTLPAGEKVVILGESGEFYKIKNADGEAFCMKKYISIK